MTGRRRQGGLGFLLAKAGAIYGLYTGMVYLLSLPGGWVADRDHRPAAGRCSTAASSIAAGQCRPGGAQYHGLLSGIVLLVTGTGLLKAHVSTIVGQPLRPCDGRRDAAFSIFYMGINLGALSLRSPAAGWGKRCWRLGFGLAGVGMIAGLIQSTLGGKYLGVAGLHPAVPDNPAGGDRRQKRRVALAAAGALAVLGILGALAATGAIAFNGRADFRRAGGGPGHPLGSGFFLAAAGRGPGPWRSARFGPRFWFCSSPRPSSGLPSYEQAGSSLNLFAEGSVNRWVDGYQFPRAGSSWWQPFFIITLRRYSPGSGSGWEARAFSPATVRFGLFFVSAGFISAGSVAGGHAVSPFWIDRHLLPAHAGRVVAQPRRIERHDQAGAHARSRMMMGLWFVFHRRGELPGRQDGFRSTDAMTIPLTTRFAITAANRHGRRHCDGGAAEAHGAPDVGVK